MNNKILFICLIIAILGCGNKSKISGAIPATRVSESAVGGNGETFPFPFLIPLTDVKEVTSKVDDAGFLAGGIAKLIMDMGAKLGMGKFQLSMIQRVPEVPSEYVKGCKIKRVFFFIEPVEGSQHESPLDPFFGRGKVNFNFLNRIWIKVGSQKIKDDGNSFIPQTGDLQPLLKGSDASKKFETIFYGLDSYPNYVIRHRFDYIDPSKASELTLLKYDRIRKNEYVKTPTSLMYIATTQNAVRTREYLVKHPDMKDFFENITIVGNSILIELEKDSIVEESFKTIVSTDKDLIAEIGILEIEECKEGTCMDLNVADVDLIHMMKRDNGIKLDAFINADKLPPSFKLKGFIEFEFRLATPKNT